MFKRQREIVNGVDVIRVPVIPRGDGGSATMLFLNYLSYLISATLRVLLLVFQKRFDCILVHETSPVTVGVPAAIVKILQRIPMYFWVLDLWPESLSAASGINNKAFGKPILAMVNGEGAEIVKDANCGFSVPAGDYKALSETIKDKVIGNAQLSALGKNGHNYYY